MHLAREIMLRAALKLPLAILRPTLIYGADDPHNGYGPNRFRRLAAKGEAITLFGEGEESRDHVHIADVAALVSATLHQRSTGTLNIATGKSTSFREVAEMVAAHSGGSVKIRRNAAAQCRITAIALSTSSTVSRRFPTSTILRCETASPLSAEKGA